MWWLGDLDTTDPPYALVSILKRFGADNAGPMGLLESINGPLQLFCPTLGNLALEVRRSTPLALAAQRGFLQGSIGRWLGQSCVARDFGGNPRQL